MSEYTRIRINVATGEIEVEGGQEFVEKQLDNLPNLLRSLKSGPANGAKPVAARPGRPRKAEVKSEPVAKPAEAPTQAKGKTPQAPAKVSAPQAEVKAPQSPARVPSTFAEWKNQFRKKISQNNQALLGGYYLAQLSDKSIFTSLQLTQALKKNDIKLANLSASLAYLVKSGKLKVIGKEGRTTVYKLNPAGEAMIPKLIK